MSILAARLSRLLTVASCRYADVVVHRLLAAALCLEPLPPAYEDRLGMKIITDNMNKRHLNSQLAGRASVALHTNIFFQNRVVVETALVMKVLRKA